MWTDKLRILRPAAVEDEKAWGGGGTMSDRLHIDSQLR